MYFEYWEEAYGKQYHRNSGFEAMCQDYNIDPREWEDIEVLLALYHDPHGYSGESFVLFRRGETLYEVNAYHCSCYGLEEQWEPEETSLTALKFRYEKGELSHYWPQNAKAWLEVILAG